MVAWVKFISLRRPRRAKSICRVVQSLLKDDRQFALVQGQCAKAFKLVLCQCQSQVVGCQVFPVCHNVSLSPRFFNFLFMVSANQIHITNVALHLKYLAQKRSVVYGLVRKSGFHLSSNVALHFKELVKVWRIVQSLSRRRLFVLWVVFVIVFLIVVYPLWLTGCLFAKYISHALPVKVNHLLRNVEGQPSFYEVCWRVVA